MQQRPVGRTSQAEKRMQDLLSQDEIDALLHGVDDGDIDTYDETDEAGIKSYDLASQDRIVRGRMPTLEMINERFARYTRISLFNLLRRNADVSTGGVQIMKFGEYIHTDGWVPLNFLSGGNFPDGSTWSERDDTTDILTFGIQAAF